MCEYMYGECEHINIYMRLIQTLMEGYVSCRIRPNVMLSNVTFTRVKVTHLILASLCIYFNVEKCS